MGRKKKRGIDPRIRADLYILFAALSNTLTAIKYSHDEEDRESNDALQPIFDELERKTRLWRIRPGTTTEESDLVRDYANDVDRVVAGMTGYETTNPAMLALSLIIHYREYGHKTIHFSGDFWKYVYALDGRVHDVEKPGLPKRSREVIKLSIEAGDILARNIVRYVEENYKRKS